MLKILTLAPVLLILAGCGDNSGGEDAGSGGSNSGVTGQAAKGDGAAFTIGGTQFAMDLPEGFCFPEGEEAAFAEQAAAVDSANQTFLHIVGCEGNDAARENDEYVLLKSSYALMNQKVSLDQLMSELKAAVGAGELDDAIQEGLEIAEDDISEASDGKSRVDTQAYGYDSSDDLCVYLTGSMDVVEGEMALTRKVASCITARGSKAIAVHSYSNSTSDMSVADLRARSRAIAEAVTQR